MTKNHNRPHRSGSWLPFAALNLRRNPFGELTTKDRIMLTVADIRPWLPMVQQPLQALQFIGRSGSGKSSHLLAIYAKLPAASYLFLPENGPLPEISPGSPWIIDEAQRLPRRMRHRVFSSTLPVVLATHTNLQRPLQRYGYQVTTVNAESLIQPARLLQIFQRRIDAARLDPDLPSCRITATDVHWLIQHYGADVRGMEYYLYKRVQENAGKPCVGGLCVELRFID